MKKNSKLYFSYEGEYSGRGAPKKYGDRINYKNIPTKFLKKSICEKSIKTDIYQMTMLHKLFSQKLNIVIMVKENLKTKARDFVILKLLPQKPDPILIQQIFKEITIIGGINTD